MAEQKTRTKKRDVRWSGASKGSSKNAGRTSHPFPLARVLRRVLPVIAMAAAFAAAVTVFRRLLPPPVVVPEASTEVAVQTFEEGDAPEDQYVGVDDPWVESGTFTMGNEGLDAQIKAFCDACSVEGYGARDNANLVYNAIVWSTYQVRESGEPPSGNDWDVALAKHFFSEGNPESGIGGVGDTYDFSAAISFCLRYFGYSDATAVPIVCGDESTGQTRAALVLVTDENGQACVCDPSLSGNGWMLDRSYYNIVVDDIGQDLTKLEELGLDDQETVVDAS